MVLNANFCRFGQKLRAVGFAKLPSAILKSTSFRLNRVIDDLYREHLFSSKLLAKAFPFKRPTILLLSYPRSGSSWIGKILGFSPDIAYLREPIHQRFQRRYKVPALLDPELRRKALRCHIHPNEEMLQYYLECSDEAFMGLVPSQPTEILENPRDLHFLQRSRKSLLIKEINPLMTKTFVNQYNPRIVMLLRHPAAVAYSFMRLNWILNEDLEDFGYWYGVHLYEALSFADSGNLLTILYEDLAANPVLEFRKLFQLLHVRSPENLEQILSDYCENQLPGDNPYEIRRSSRTESEKWKTGFSGEQIEAVMGGYLRSELQYYRDSQPR